MQVDNASRLTGWRKSTFSNPSGNCVNVTAVGPGLVGLADSKDMAGPALLTGRRAFRAFIDGAKAGEFDDLA